MLQREFVSLTLLLAIYLGTSPSLAEPVNFELLKERAFSLAQEDYVDRRGGVPAELINIGYDEYQSINFDASKALWKDEGLFTVQFFHPGFYFDRTVTIYQLVDGDSRRIPFSPELFNYRKLDPSKFDLAGLGFAGFRLHYPLHSDRYFDEFAVFQGASYFRLVGRGQSYGLSARGLAIDTASEHGEEFPSFEEFWIEKPAPQATEITLYALLNSASVVGAYRFVLRPRTETQVEVRAVLYPRKNIEKLGLAPLTSMFLYGEDQHRLFDDFRPEVHDSDGLMMQTGGGEWIWRPLVNRRNLNLSLFFDDNPRGFGLVQRDRDFAHYQDLGAKYHRRPSAWIQPLGDWGPGHVELVEIPSDSEINDNIVSYWVSEIPVVPGKPIEFAYLLSSFLQHGTWPPGGLVVSTRVGTADRPGAQDKAPQGSRLFVVDFNAGDLPFIGEEQPVEAVVASSSGGVSGIVTQKNNETGGWRLFFDFHPEDDKPSDIRAFLRLRDHVLTETWNYLWTRGSQ